MLYPCLLLAAPAIVLGLLGVRWFRRRVGTYCWVVATGLLLGAAFWLVTLGSPAGYVVAIAFALAGVVFGYVGSFSHGLTATPKIRNLQPARS